MVSYTDEKIRGGKFMIYKWRGKLSNDFQTFDFAMIVYKIVVTVY